MAVRKEQIDEMTPQERLWSSLEYSHGKQREEIQKTYKQAKSQADRQALAKGMQRSSHNLQVQANLDQQSIEAQNQSYEAQNAAYASGLNQLEQQQKEDERWERQFAANRADTEWNQRFQQEQADTAKDQWSQQFAADKQYKDWNMGFQQEQADTAKDQWSQQFAADQQYKDWSMGFQQEQAKLAQDQWERQFAQTTATTDQQIALGWVQTALANGQVPSDELLARAGLTRADAELMKKQVSGGGSNPGSSKKPWELLGMTEDQYNALLKSGQQQQPTNNDLSAYLAALGGNADSAFKKGASGLGISNPVYRTDVDMAELMRMAR